MAVVTGVGALSLAGLFLPDQGVRWGLIRTLRDFGMIDVKVADSALSLFNGHLVVRDVVARPPLGSPFGLSDFVLNFRWAPLFRRQVVIDRIAMTGVTIDLHRDPGSDVIVINGLPLALGASASVSGDSPPSPPSWGIDLTELDLTDSRLHLSIGALVADIAIKHLHVANLRSRNPDQPVTFTLDGALNSAPVVLSGTVLPFAADPSFTLTLSVKDLDLTAIAPALAEIGLTGTRGKSDLAVTAAGQLAATGPRIEGTGHLSIAGASLATPVAFRADQLGLDLRHLVWKGTATEIDATADVAGLTLTLAPGQSLGVGKARLEVPAAQVEGARFTARGSLTSEDFAFRGTESDPDVTAAQVRWNGDLISAPGAPFRIGGTVELGTARIDGEDYDASVTKLGLNGRLATTGAAFPIRSEGPLALALEGVRFTLADLTGTAEQTRFTGQLVPAPARSALPVSLEGSSQFDLRDLHLTAPDFTATVSEAGIVADIDPVPAGGPVPLAVRGTLKAERITLAPPRGTEDWLAVEHLSGETLILDRDGQASAARIGVEGIAALRRRGTDGYPWRVELRTLRLESPLYDGRDVEAEELRLEGLTVRLTRTGTGLLGFSPPRPTAAPVSRDASRSAPPPRVTLARLGVGGGSRLTFEDRTLPEPLRLEAKPIELMIERIDGTRPDRDSPFRLATNLGGASLDARGVIRPFEPGGRLESQINALELPQLSAYVADALGLQIRTGHFSGTVRGEARSGLLDGAIELTLSNLALTTSDPHAPLLQRTGLPIETVLDLLRDGEGRIRLSIPVKGQFNAPNFDFSDAIGQAVGGALSSAVMTTLKVAFPLTALISLIDDEGGGHLTLAPVSFSPGDAALNEEQRHVLDQAAGLLRGRDGLRLTLCGKANLTEAPLLAAQRRAEERPVLTRLERWIGAESPPAAEAAPLDHTVLRALADRRAEAAKTYLTDQAGIPAERVFTCRGEIEDGADKPPRVDLLL